MSSSGALPSEPLPVQLIKRDDLANLQIRFPRQDPRFENIEELPALVVVQSDENGRQEIAGTEWWGDRSWNPQDTAVEASPKLTRAMAGRGESSHNANRKPAKVRRARWWDVVLYARGFRASLLMALLGFLAALALAAVGVATVGLPLWIVAGVLCVVAVVEGVKGIKAVADSLRV